MHIIENSKHVKEHIVNRPVIPFGTRKHRKKYLEDLFSSVLSYLKKYLLPPPPEI